MLEIQLLFIGMSSYYFAETQAQGISTCISIKLDCSPHSGLGAVSQTLCEPSLFTCPRAWRCPGERGLGSLLTSLTQEAAVHGQVGPHSTT